jgi:putative ABC transport system ATP-binding protein
VTAAMLEARSVGYQAGGQQILSDVDLVVQPGERVAVVGPSGSGKSSLLAVLAGLARPSQGQVLLDGSPLLGMAGRERGVAVVLQGYGLVSLLTASENVEIALLACRRDRHEARRIAVEELAELGMGAHRGQLVEELSGGQQQRTAVARALSLRPRLLIADEPTAEQDPVTRTLVLARMLEIAERGAAVVLATHDPDVAARCDRILDLHR